MDNIYFLPVASSIIVFMLGIIGWFLIRFVKQYDEANKDHSLMFEKLLKRFDTLTEIIYEHKTDVEVIKSQLHEYNKDIGAANNLFNSLFDRVRITENDIAILKERHTH